MKKFEEYHEFEKQNNKDGKKTILNLVEELEKGSETLLNNSIKLIEEEYEKMAKDNELLKKRVLNLSRELAKYKELTEPFKDAYFEGLSYKTIAELAKKSIRITEINNKYLHALEDMEELLINEKALNDHELFQAIADKVDEVINGTN